MAENVFVASSAAAAAEHGGSAAAEPAGTEDRTPLTELISDETGAAGTWDLKVFDSNIRDYQYTWKGREQTGRKLVIILLSLDADQYCLGLARAAKSGDSLEALQSRFATGTVWRFPNVTLFTSEKPQYLHTACPSACARPTLRECCRARASPRLPNPPQPSRRYFS